MSSATKITPFISGVSTTFNIKNSSSNLKKKLNGKMANDTSSASTHSNDSSSDPLESDYSEGSCEEDEVKATKRPIIASKQQNFALEDLQIMKTIGEYYKNIKLFKQVHCST